MLHLHHANRHEALRDRLIGELAAVHGPFVREPVIVPNAAHRRAIALAVADASGICANVGFAYLAQWLWQQVARVVPGVGAQSPFAADAMTWPVWRAFGDAGFIDAQARLAAYLRGSDARGRHELARRAAALLERCVTWRADWLQAWDEGGLIGLGPDEAWQAALWRRLAAELGEPGRHPRQAFEDALQRDGTGLVARGVLPARAHVVALPAIAPQHLQMLRRLAGCIELHVYALNPCAEYWFEIVSPRRLSALRLQGRAQAHETGNPWLAAWGRQTQAQLEALVAIDDDGTTDTTDFRPAGGTTLLARVQDAVLGLQELEPGSVRLAADDRSVELHVCHSLARELEVLQDRLLGLLAADPTLRAGDILVALPDLAAAAPLIDAVFGTATRARRIAYTIAARPESSANRAARALLGVLALAASRGHASDCFALLQEPLVARRFGLDDDALARLRGWLVEAGFHWGFDDAHVAALGLPPQRHTLAAALARLLLGHALPDAVAEPFAGLLPAGGAWGSDADALGALAHFGQRLAHWAARLAAPCPPAQWGERLHALLADFVDAGDDALDEQRALHAAIAAALEPMRAAVPDEPLPLAVLRDALAHTLDDPARGGAAGGGVTFADTGALRGLPHRVVCVIGLNDGAFPRPARPDEFDLIARAPRRGDRLPRDDDRAAFLDLVLAARSHLHLSFTGRSARDGSELPPSVLVSELIEPLVRASAHDPLDADSLRAARARLVVQHPLQPFAPAAFGAGADPRCRSTAAELAAALRSGLAAAAARAAAPGGPALAADADAGGDDEGDDDGAPGLQAPFFAAPLAPPPSPLHALTLAELRRFFRNPCRELLRRRLRLHLPFDDDDLADDEPLVPGWAQRRALAERLLPALLRGSEGEPLQQLARAGAEWPAGAVGEQLLAAELAALRVFAARVRAAAPDAPLPPHASTLSFDLDGQAWELRAPLDSLHVHGNVGWRCAPLRARDRLDAWLQHLVLCADPPAGTQQRTRWLLLDAELVFAPVSDAHARLAALLRLVRRGLAEPLRFFPDSAWACVDRGRDEAQRVWESSEYRRGESADPAYALALRGVAEPLDAAFVETAHQVYGPLRDALEDAR
ncbi:MAG: exodeoxyribonuclease V subunit gamma [Rubrivivax sp.]